jgi:DNA modification methylase
MPELKEPRPQYDSSVAQPRLFATEIEPELQTPPKEKVRAPRKIVQPLATTVDPITWVTDGKYPSKTLKLFDDVSQVYELLLARMEFLSLGHDLLLLRQRAAYFEEVNGEKSDHFFLSAVRGKGQIGHSNQYLTHWFYPYKGKYHGQMIKALINFMGVGRDSLILDPFVGSGTTLVECATLGIPSIGIDINPALCVVSQIKVDSLAIDYPQFQRELTKAKPLDIFQYFLQKPEIANKWFLGFGQLNQDTKFLLAQAWEHQFPDGFVKELPDTWRNLLFLCYLHALSDHTYLQNTNKAMPFEQFFLRDLNEYLDTISGSYRVFIDRHVEICPPKVLFGTALELPLPSNTVDGIVTSPPYSIALDYIKNDKHLLDYLGIDTSELKEQMLGLKGRSEEKIRFYRVDMKKSLQEMYRVLKPGCYAAILLGDVVVGTFRTNFAKEIVNWSKELAFSEAELIRRPILGGYARLRYEYIILLRK